MILIVKCLLLYVPDLPTLPSFVLRSFTGTLHGAFFPALPELFAGTSAEAEVHLPDVK